MVPTLIRICRIQWCCSLFLFSSGNTFLGKLGPKNQNYQLKLKFGTYANSNMQNSMVMFTFSVYDQKYPSWAILVQKVRIISWSWNLVPRLIRICLFCWLFCFHFEIPFFGKFGPKNQNYQFKKKFDAYTNSNTCANFNGDVRFFCFWSCALFGKIWHKMWILPV